MDYVWMVHFNNYIELVSLSFTSETMQEKDTVCSGENTLDTDCEIAWTKIQLKGCKALCTGCFYRKTDNEPSALENPWPFLHVLSLRTIWYRSGSSISDVGIDLSKCVSCRWIMCGWCVSIIVLSSFLLASLLKLRQFIVRIVSKDTVCSGEDTLDTDCEITWTKIQLKGCKALYTGCFYRKPDNEPSALENLNNSLSRRTHNNTLTNVILTGDFNLWCFGLSMVYSILMLGFLMLCIGPLHWKGVI
jgi:hypothetical protein